MSKGLKKEKRVLIHKKYKGKCAYCGNKVDYDKMHVDHIVPLYRKWTQKELDEYGITKGTNNIDNLNPSCATCNISKSTFTLENWRKEIKLKVNRVRKSNSNVRLLESFGIIIYRNKDVVFHFEKKQK